MKSPLATWLGRGSSVARALSGVPAIGEVMHWAGLALEVASDVAAAGAPAETITRVADLDPLVAAARARRLAREVAARSEATYDEADRERAAEGAPSFVPGESVDD